MSTQKLNKTSVVSITILFVLLAAGCSIKQNTVSGSEVSKPTVSSVESQVKAQDMLMVASQNGFTSAQPSTVFASNCMHPAGWQAYTIQAEDTAEGIQQRFNVNFADLLGGNCLTTANAVTVGQVIYVPSLQQNFNQQTILPLSVSAFAADQTLAQPGSTVRLMWHGQGTIASVRIGTVFSGRFYETVASLPANGVVDVEVPNDGRDTVTYMVRVSDGEHEISATTTISIACNEGWFFSPAPAGCPTAPMLTTFYEQRFDYGTIVYVPTLGVHYMMVTGQEVVELEDNYVPGTPLPDPTMSQAQAAIYSVWNHEQVQALLGKPVDKTEEYPGLMQRTTNPDGTQIYISAGSGHVYRFGNGMVWGVIIPS